jgi:hypothetical protein
MAKSTKIKFSFRTQNFENEQIIRIVFALAFLIKEGLGGTFDKKTARLVLLKVGQST